LCGLFYPLVERGTPRRVLLLNLEGSGSRFQSDLRVMTRDFSEIELTTQNFFPTHAPVIGDEPLSLSRHMKLMEAHARRVKSDDIIIDTASAAFSLRNENDNSEVANSVMKPLVKLARRLNCLVILIHHIGKAKLEEGSTREQAHRGRGASAWGDFSTSIFNLEADAKDKREPDSSDLWQTERRGRL
jgi:RecA-family ATPase